MVQQSDFVKQKIAEGFTLQGRTLTKIGTSETLNISEDAAQFARLRTNEQTIPDVRERIVLTEEGLPQTRFLERQTGGSQAEGTAKFTEFTEERFQEVDGGVGRSFVERTKIATGSKSVGQFDPTTGQQIGGASTARISGTRRLVQTAEGVRETGGVGRTEVMGLTDEELAEREAVGQVAPPTDEARLQQVAAVASPQLQQRIQDIELQQAEEVITPAATPALRERIRRIREPQISPQEIKEVGFTPADFPRERRIPTGIEIVKAEEVPEGGFTPLALDQLISDAKKQDQFTPKPGKIETAFIKFEKFDTSIAEKTTKKIIPEEITTKEAAIEFAGTPAGTFISPFEPTREFTFRTLASGLGEFRERPVKTTAIFLASAGLGLAGSGARLGAARVLSPAAFETASGVFGGLELGTAITFGTIETARVLEAPKEDIPEVAGQILVGEVIPGLAGGVVSSKATKGIRFRAEIESGIKRLPEDVRPLSSKAIEVESEVAGFAGVRPRPRKAVQPKVREPEFEIPGVSKKVARAIKQEAISQKEEIVLFGSVAQEAQLEPVVARQIRSFRKPGDIEFFARDTTKSAEKFIEAIRKTGVRDVAAKGSIFEGEPKATITIGGEKVIEFQPFERRPSVVLGIPREVKAPSGIRLTPAREQFQRKIAGPITGEFDRRVKDFFDVQTVGVSALETRRQELITRRVVPFRQRKITKVERLQREFLEIKPPAEALRRVGAPEQFTLEQPSSFIRPKKQPAFKVTPLGTRAQARVNLPGTASIVTKTTPSRVPRIKTKPSKLPSIVRKTPSQISKIPSKLPSQVSKIPSGLPSVVPSKIPSKVPSKAPSKIKKKPSRLASSLSKISGVPSEVPSRVPSKIPAISRISVPSRLPSRLTSAIPSQIRTTSAISAVPSRIAVTRTTAATDIPELKIGEPKKPTRKKIKRRRGFVPSPTLVASELQIFGQPIRAATGFETIRPVARRKRKSRRK